MELKDKITERLTAIEFQVNYNESDITFIEAAASKNLIYYLEKTFPNAVAVLKLSEVYQNYMLKKIFSFIQLEHELEIELGNNNTGASEKAKETIILNINSELKEIESICNTNPELIQQYYPYEDELGDFIFKNKEERFYVDNLKIYDLDQHAIVESIS